MKFTLNKNPNTLSFLCFQKKFFWYFTTRLLHGIHMTYIHVVQCGFNPKTAGGRGQFDPPCGFLKNVFFKERVKPWFFVTFNFIVRYIYPENFIEFAQVVQKIWRNYMSILANFYQFSSIFWIFWHYLVTKKLMASAYNRWCQHFFTINILWIDCLTII